MEKPNLAFWTTMNLYFILFSLRKNKFTFQCVYNIITLFILLSIVMSSPSVANRNTAHMLSHGYSCFYSIFSANLNYSETFTRKYWSKWLPCPTNDFLFIDRVRNMRRFSDLRHSQFPNIGWKIWKWIFVCKSTNVHASATSG